MTNIDLTAGHNGKTKFAIENATRTRVVLAGQKVHILGTFKNAKMAQEAIVSLILGSPPVSLIVRVSFIPCSCELIYRNRARCMATFVPLHLE